MFTGYPSNKDKSRELIRGFHLDAVSKSQTQAACLVAKERK